MLVVEVLSTAPTHLLHPPPPTLLRRCTSFFNLARPHTRLARSHTHTHAHNLLSTTTLIKPLHLDSIHQKPTSTHTQTHTREMFAFLVQPLVSLGLPLVAYLLLNHLAESATPPADSRGAAATTTAAAKAAGTTTTTATARGTAQGSEHVDAFSRSVEAELAALGSAAATASKAAPRHGTAAAPSPPPSTSAPAAAAPATARGVASGGAEILIAYATQSQNSLTLAHKLFSLITAQLHAITTASTSTPADGTDAGAALVCPTVRIMEMREEEDGDGEDGADGVASPSKPKVKGKRNICGVDTILDNNAYALTIFVVSTYTDGTAPPRSQTFEAVLKDAFEDHRVPRNTLARKRFAVFGLGDIAYGEARFNTFAKHLHEWCRGLGAPAFVVPPVYATEAKAQSLFRVFSTALLRWLNRASFHADGNVTVKRKAELATARRADGGGGGGGSGDDKDTIAPPCCQNGEISAAQTCCNSNDDGATSSGADRSSGNGCCCCGNGSEAAATTASATAAAQVVVLDSDDDDDDDAGAAEEADMDDVEDLVWDGTDDADFDIHADPTQLPELLYPKLRQSLEKQGYRLIGSHSGVKLCRWTKSMLRGRGGCYKHAFYDINSSQCMEMTPSLACANKCVFCWRHHTNPISRHFRWKQDPPELLIAQGMAGHYQMIKQMRGVPGVTPERLATAMQIRHCALSLVGEPIMYPQINGFCDLLHQHHISSFMVTNAQFPEQLRDLKPVVQLYLSIDAPTPDELKRIDRPLFEDYWDRCLSCVKELAKKRQRTVFRLTLVNQYNTENVKAYADLVEMGQPDFIEVKGVTYCGTSTSATLTMKENVPRHDEVIGFCNALCAEMAARQPNYRTPQMHPAAGEGGSADAAAAADAIVIPLEERDRPYHVACEHEHSCCVLIALDKFFFDQHWHTWIDYGKFYELVESGRTDFTSLDYAAETPTWATYKSKEKGFDPAQTRVVRKNARPTIVTASC